MSTPAVRVIFGTFEFEDGQERTFTICGPASEPSWSGDGHSDAEPIVDAIAKGAAPYLTEGSCI